MFLSQRRINQVVDVAPKHVRVELRKDFAATNEFCRSGAGAWQRAEFGHRGAVAGNDETFAVLDAT